MIVRHHRDILDPDWVFSGASVAVERYGIRTGYVVTCGN
jgi:hypothetical protein